MVNFAKVLSCFVAALFVMAPPSQARAPDFITYYYRDKQLEKVPVILAEIDGGKLFSRPSARGSLTGFLVGLFSENPDKIELWVSKPFNAKTEVFLAFAMAMSNQKDRAIRFAQERGLPREIEKSLRSMPDSLEQISINSPTDLDTLWGASLATGNKTYPSKILHWLNQTIQSKGQNLDELEQLLNAYGGPSFGDQAKALSSKYPKKEFIDLIVSTSALWSMKSNAKQHAFVKDVVDNWTRENSGNTLARLLRKK